MIEVNNETPVTEIYKGYEIQTTPNGTHFNSLILKGGKEIGGTFAGPLEPLNSTEKARLKIDCRIDGTDYNVKILALLRLSNKL